jgi:PTS system cellobiose-specific IIB component
MTVAGPIRVLIVCAGGMSSSLLETKTIEAARVAGVDLHLSSLNLLDVARWDFNSHGIDILLVAPQIRFLRGRIENTCKPYQIIVDTIDTVTYGMVDGENLFKQILSAIEAG